MSDPRPTLALDREHAASRPQNAHFLRKPLSRDSSVIRLLLTTAILLFAVFLFVRTVALEPFGVPTGSMAPTLLGNHREGICPRCAYPLKVGFPPAGISIAEQYHKVACLNCGQFFSLESERDISGDRLLVDKNVYDLRRPRRLEMAVFHCPDPDPQERGKPYVKRVIGLPGESIQIVAGDIYVDDRLIRKDLQELRETRVPVMNMDFVPQPMGWNSHWLMEPSGNDPRLPLMTTSSLQVARATIVNSCDIHLDASTPQNPVVAVRYRHWDLDRQQQNAIRAWSSYDGAPRDYERLPETHDFSVSCDVEVVAAEALAQFRIDLSDGSDTVRGEIPVGSLHEQQVLVIQEHAGLLKSRPEVTLEVGKTYHVEMGFVDRRVLLAIDGKPVLSPTDLPAIRDRGEVRFPVQLQTSNCNLIVHHFVLYRDIYYTQFGEHGTRHPAVLGPDEYFVLGDNSGNSQDSRKWPSPAVAGRNFIGKPFLMHQPLHPQRLNFGGMERQFQTVDWSRLRWIH